MNRKFLGLVVGIILITLACGSVTPSTPDQSGVGTIVAETLQAVTVNAPTLVPPTLEPTVQSGIPVSFQNVSFVIPNGLASGAAGTVVAAVTEENGAPWDAAPEHIQFTLNGYMSTGKFSAITINVYPAQGYSDSYPGATNSIHELQAILASPSAQLTNDALPNVPYFNAAQMFAAQTQRINFASGSGVRMVTQYGQAVGSVTNNGVFYHFQGLTGDGKYYVVVVLPVGSPLLVSGEGENEPVPAGGVPFPGYTTLDPKDYEAYFQAVTDVLNASSPESFQPSLSQLDELIQSITITSQ
ncbi:MAG: hypothetical protein HZB50_08630 [Chloroflexi bacterium]|nr:hypothetical protein [Chloroflexota bacterium]